MVGLKLTVETLKGDDLKDRTIKLKFETATGVDVLTLQGNLFKSVGRVGDFNNFCDFLINMRKEKAISSGDEFRVVFVPK